MKIWVSGSIAYDIILDYQGKFADQIDRDKVHALNLSFPVEKVKKTVGGTAANIAYNLNMLDMDTGIIGSVGRDAKDLIESYRKAGIDVSLVQVSDKHGTASAYIMTDKDDNQINAFYGGAMNEPAERPDLNGCDWPIVSAENPNNMTTLAKHYQKAGKQYIFDPGQALFVLTKQQIKTCLKKASILIGNDYEISQLLKKSGLKKFKQVVYKTLGRKGTEITFPNEKTEHIQAVKAKKEVDPTGAGDAYRAGLIKGIAEGLDLVTAGQLASTAAVCAVEKHGTQEHEFNYDILVKRHNRNFLKKIPTSN